MNYLQHEEKPFVMSFLYLVQTSEIRNQYSTTTSTLQLDVIHEKIPFIQESSLIFSDGHHNGTWHMQTYYVSKLHLFKKEISLYTKDVRKA